MLAQQELPDPSLVDQILVVINNLVSVAATQVLEHGSDETIKSLRDLLTPLMQQDSSTDAHNEARFSLMKYIMLASNNLPLQLIARTLFEQFAPNISAIGGHALQTAHATPCTLANWTLRSRTKTYRQCAPRSTLR